MVSPDAPSTTLPVGDWRARLTLTARGRVSTDYLDPTGAARARLPREVARAHSTALAAAKARARDIEHAIGEARSRLEQSFREGRDWSVADWRSRYVDHPLTRGLAQRLIWRFTPARGDPIDALGTTMAIDRDGALVQLPADGRVRLWHPTDAGAVAQDWRQFCLDRGVRQPFFQAWRPVYDITAPEAATRVYSNRFAGLVLEQPVLVRLLRARGWVLHSRMLDCVPKNFAPARLALPADGLVCEYWGTGMGVVEERHEYGAPNFPYFASQQIRFYRSADLERSDRLPVPLAEVPRRAFGEAMFDIDLATGIAAAGWVPNYRDPGPEALPPPPDRRACHHPFDTDLTGRALDRLGDTRRDMLAWLLPRLAIGERCTIDGGWVRVRGEWGDYGVHCGNAAVRVIATNRHVCIVPAPSGPVLDQLLPVIGDEMLSLIVSKVTMLAHEPRIRDADIVRQLR